VIVHYLPADCNPSPLQLVAFLLVSNCQAIRSRTIGYFMRQSCKKRRWSAMLVSNINSTHTIANKLRPTQAEPRLLKRMRINWNRC
jgi:hypothetical protein